ncbi:MAG: transglutaminaseTgpA domain-containing protein [Mycobacteriales bacterium]
MSAPQRSTQHLTLIAAMACFLGAVPLSGAFQGHRWLVYCALAIGIVALLGLAGRTLGVPALLTPLIQLAGLVVFHAAAFSSNARWAVLPTPSTFRDMRSTYQHAVDIAQTTAPPVPVDTSMLMVVSLALGLVAVAVDLVTAGLRRPAIAGLALLALYAVGTSISGGVSWLGFLCAGAGFLLLLLAEGRERLAAWGRIIGRNSSDTGRNAGQSAATRIGITALAIAVIVPLAIPGFTANLLTSFAQSRGQGIGNGKGSTGSRIDPFTSLRGQLRDDGVPYNLFRFTTNVQDPFYLRTSVLGDYTGTGWKQADGDKTVGTTGTLPAPATVADRPGKGVRTATVHVTTQDYTGGQVPVFYSVQRLQADKDRGRSWKYRPELGTVAGSSLERGTTYTATSIEPVYTQAELKAAQRSASAGLDQYLSLPKLPAKVRAITTTAVAGASTPYQISLNLYNYFADGTQGFHYSLNTRDGTSGNDLLDFLNNQQGFCEQYASAMAVMLRLERIPSRVVLGYTPDGDVHGGYQVTNKDAHAWVEAYLGGVGWVSFDPTPLSADRVQAPNIPTVAPPTGTGAPNEPTPPRVTPNHRPEQQHPSGSAAGAGPPTDNSGSGPGTTLLAVCGVALVLILLALTPMTVRAVQRRRRFRIAAGPDPVRAAESAWQELLATARDHGLSALTTESPRATVGRLVQLISPEPAASSGMRLVALAAERAAYARHAGVNGDLRTALRVSRAAIVDGTPRRSRVTRALLPLSLRGGLRESVDREVGRVRATARALASIVRRPRRAPG